MLGFGGGVMAWVEGLIGHTALGVMLIAMMSIAGATLGHIAAKKLGWAFEPSHRQNKAGIRLADNLEVIVDASLGPVPESELVSLLEAIPLLQERWAEMSRAEAREFVWQWREKWKRDTTHTWMQDGKIVRKNFLQWVEKAVTQQGREG